MHKYWWWPIILVIIWVNLIISLPDNDLHYVQCDVGQGDAVLLYKGSKQILIDGGKSFSKLESCFLSYMPFWDRKIEVMILTHADIDHIGSASKVIDKYKINYAIWNNYQSQDKTWQNLYKKLNKNHIKLVAINSPITIKYGKLKIKFLWPDYSLINRLNIASSTFNQSHSYTANNLSDNDYSLIFQFFYGNHSGTLSGDAPKWVEGAVLQDLQPSEVLKLSHHGSKTANSQEFLDKINPKITVIGVGKNSYGHPNKSVLNRVASGSSSLYRTDLDGDIEIIFKDKLLVRKGVDTNKMFEIRKIIQKIVNFRG